MQLNILVKFGLDGVDPVEALVRLLDAKDFEQERNT